MSVPRHIGLRILAIGILLVVIFSATMVVIWPVHMVLISQENKFRSSLLLLAKYRAVAAQRPILESELAELRKQTASIPGLIKEKNVTLAAAKLQSEIRSIIESRGGQIRSTQNLSPSKIGSFDKIDIRYDFAIPTNHLRELVYQLDTHMPYLFFDAVEAHVSENVQLDGPDAAPPNMDVRWTITAYRLAGES